MRIVRMLRRLRALFSRRRFRRVERVSRRSSLRSMDPNTIYMVGQPEQWLMFTCPCSDTHEIALTIGDTGQWRLSGSRSRPTIHPSINATDVDRRCHYWLTAGQIRWCADSYRSERPAGADRG